MPPPPAAPATIRLGPILGDAGDVALRAPDGASASLPPNLVGNPAAVIAFYVSAHWCPPCRAFTPVLARTYGALLSADMAARKKSDGDGDGGKAGTDAPAPAPSPPPPFEFVFVSADRSREAFEAYADAMPWPALDYDSNRRETALDALGVTGIPALILVSGDGRVLTRAGVPAARRDPTGRGFPWEGARLPVWQRLPPAAHWAIMFLVMQAVKWVAAWWQARGGKAGAVGG